MLLRIALMTMGLLAGLAGCPAPEAQEQESDMKTPPDSSAATRFDLAFSGVRFCAGTPLAGTCVQEFLEPAWQLFRPVGGCQSERDEATWTTRFCWQSGAKLVQQSLPPPELYIASASQAGVPCLQSHFFVEITDNPPRSSVILRVERDGRSLRINTKTGEIVCPDGAQFTIPDYSNACAQLNRLVVPHTESCTPGVCP